MAKLLVHLHLYYHKQVDYFISKMKNITCDEWDLVVTFTEGNEESVKKLSDFKPGVKFLKTENYGYDILPFISVVKNTNLSDYDYVIKLHTKRGYPKKRGNGILQYEWRDSLVDAILFSKDHFNKMLERFEKESDLGMISSLKYFYGDDPYEKYVMMELTDLGLGKVSKHFCAGSMFMTRANILEPLKKEAVSIEKFKDETPESGSTISYSHIYERLLSYLPENLNYVHKPVSPQKSEYIALKTAAFFNPVGKFFFSMSREGVERKKVLRIMGLKLYSSKRGKGEKDVEKLEKLFEGRTPLSEK